MPRNLTQKQKQPNLKLKTWPKHLLSSLPLAYTPSVMDSLHLRILHAILH